LTLDTKREYFRQGWFRFAARIFFTAAIPVLFFWVCLVNGARIKGIQNLRGLRSAVSVCNHVHKMDSALIASAFYPRKPVFPTRPEKVYRIFPGIIFNLLGCVSIPRTPGETHTFFREMKRMLNEGKIVHFFPEGFISPYGKELQSFKRGAFFLAAQAQAPVVPMAISFHEPRGGYKIIRKKPVMLLTIGEPMQPVSPNVKEDESARAEAVCQRMLEMLK